MANLQKNVASQNITFGLVNSSSGAALTGATVTVYVTKDNGAQATGTGTVTEKGNGQYNYAPTQAETNAADVGLLFTATSAIPVAYDFHTDVVDANGYPGANLVDIAGAAVSTSSAQIGVNAVNIGGTAQTGRDIGASVLLSAGTGTGQLDFTSGVVKANLTQILGTALTETAGQIAAAFKKFFNIASPTSTMNEITLVDTVTTTTTATNLTNAPTAGDFTATMKTSIGTAVAASAVASVTGNVDGNVAGSVGSVTAAVSVTGDLSSTMKSSVTTACNAATTVGVNSNVKKGAQLTAFSFTMTDSTTGDEKTGLTVTSQIAKDGGTFASTTNSVTEMANGWYKITLTATEMNADQVALRFSATGAVTKDVLLVTQP